MRELIVQRSAKSGDALRDRTSRPQVSLRSATDKNQREYNGTSLDTRTLGIFGSAAAWSYPNGPPAARTMAPGDRPGQACTVCHGGAANPVNSFGGNVRITFPNGLTYTPGQAQDLTVTVSDSSAATFGFELTARSDSSRAAPRRGLLRRARTSASSARTGRSRLRAAAPPEQACRGSSTRRPR